MSTKQAPAPRPPSPRGAPDGVDVEEAEAALVENYPRLVRLAYLTLPPALGRHRRVLTAHAIVQRALPRPRGGQGGRPGGAAGGTSESACALVRERVLRGALRYEEQPAWQRLAASALPQVWGLRLHPKAGGTDEGTLDRALAGLDARARAAYALREVEGLGEGDARLLLAAAGVVETGTALSAAARVGRAVGDDFDPCTVQARPTDLLRRRQHTRIALAAGAVLAVAGALAGGCGAGGQDPSAAGSPGPYAAAARARLDPAGLVRARATGWTSTSRLDFTAWPARGDRTGDSALLGRALAAWARPGGRVAVSATTGTPAGPPAGRPQLLYAGDVDGAAVVLLHDGLRVVRYAEPPAGAPGRTTTLDFARVDGADLASATAVVVGRTDGNARFLTAPWVTSVAVADLLRPADGGQELQRSADGVTGLVRMPAAGPSCDTWPAMRFTVSESAGGGRRPFLLTDLGDLTPVHLAYRTADGAAPVEATGPLARASWSRTACRLPSVRGQGMRTVTGWEYTRQTLPEDGGEASWVCLRADTWRGTGRALALFTQPGSGPATLLGRSGRATDACGGTRPQVLAAAVWKSAAGRWYLLAAGGRDTARITATGGIRGSAEGGTLAVRAEPSARAEVSAVLGSGRTVTMLR